MPVYDCIVTSHKVEVNSSFSNRIPGMVQNRVTLSGCYNTPLGCKYFIVIYPRFVPTGTARVGYYYFVPPELNKPNRYPRYVPEEQNNPSPRVNTLIFISRLKVSALSCHGLSEKV